MNRPATLAALCLTALICLPVLAQAQGPGNPTGLIQKGRLAVGLEGEYVFRHQFSDYDLRRSSPIGAPDSESKSAKFEGNRLVLATITYGLTDWLNLQGRLGYVDGGTWHDTDLATGEEWQARLKACFVWSLGAKARLWEHPKGLGIIAGAQYLRYDDRQVDQWKNDTRGYKADTYWSTHDRLDYWQVDLTVTGYWRLGVVRPFVGLGWSHSETKSSGRWADLSDPSVYVDYDSSMYDQNQFSVTVGIEFEVTPHLRLNLYGLLVTRTALGLGLSWVF